MLHTIWQSRMLPVTDAEGPGIVWLDDLATVTFTGHDARQFLQGYLTSDTTLLDATPRPTAVCSRQGRVVVDGLAWSVEDTVTILVHASLAGSLCEFLKPYLAFSRTRAVDRTGERLVFGGFGRARPRVSRPIGDDRWIAVADTLDEAATIWAEGGTPRHRDAWMRRDIDELFPWVSAATSDAFLPQMLNLADAAVSFDKGCYLGQEIVARAQHRGQVKRTLMGLDWSGTVPAAGDELTTGGRVAGTVVMATTRPDNGRALAVMTSSTVGDVFESASETRYVLSSGLNSH